MTEILAKIKKNTLNIDRKDTRKNEYSSQIVDLSTIENDVIYKSIVSSYSEKQKNCILLDKNILNKEIEETKERLIVYIKNSTVYYYKTDSNIYKRLIMIKKKIIKIQLTRNKCKFLYVAFIVNPLNIEIQETNFYLDNENKKNIKLNEYKDGKLNIIKILKNIHFISFDMNEVLDKEAEINNAITINLTINNDDSKYYFGKKSKKIKDSRLYYVPFKTKFIKDYAVHFRRSQKGSVIFVRRKKENIENSLKFRVFESTLFSKILFFTSRIYKKVKKYKINLYFEKFSFKAEEGAYDLFKYSQKSLKSKNYFIINKNSPDYPAIKNEKNVIIQYSLKYYWLFYISDNFIATEVPAHLNLLRSNNKTFRKEMVKKQNIFLQHGIIYLKNLGKNSVFIKGKDGSCDYIVASSQKECEVICEQLKMKEENVLITGLGIFSKVKYKHITNDFKDTATIMLTWKPYEEHLEDFSTSSYYQNTIKIYNILSKYLKKENIFIVAHPKTHNLLLQTDLKDNMWQRPISEVLGETKLMITDYSSVCYNSFYQGAGVIFMQPDLKLYEADSGELIPSDKEYIGHRLYHFDELDKLIKGSTKQQKIILDKLRTKEHEKIYKTINEFSDGKNIQRIYEELDKLQII